MTPIRTHYAAPFGPPVVPTVALLRPNWPRFPPPRRTIRSFDSANLLHRLSGAMERELRQRNRQPGVVAQRRQFARRARAAGISSSDIARWLRVHHSTVMYYLRGWRGR